MNVSCHEGSVFQGCVVNNPSVNPVGFLSVSRQVEFALLLRHGWDVENWRHVIKHGVQVSSPDPREQMVAGCAVRVDMNEGYPAVMNPPELYARVRQVTDFRELAAPMMITEDFSWYQRSLPGLFFLLGAGDVPALHSDNFHFNEEILLKGADFFEILAEKFQ